jgi:hypothetical protein
MSVSRRQFDGVWESLARTQDMVAESRHLLEAFYSGRDAPYVKHATMICILCDYEAEALNRLDFRASNRNGEYPRAALSLMLKRFGVCDSCVVRYGGKGDRLFAALNRQVAMALAA